MTQQLFYQPLKGGEDLVSPALSISPGALLYSSNYEPAEEGGYRRIDGFERFDGMPAPSEATYLAVPFDGGAVEPSVGATITGGTSGDTGVLIAIVLDSGTWAGANAEGWLILHTYDGTYQDDETLQVTGPTNIANVNGTSQVNGVASNANRDSWLQTAIEAARTLIAAVPGSGQIRGVWGLAGSVYAFRDNAGATACVMHKATTAGWVAQDLGAELDFTTGSVEFTKGETLTGGTSGATGVVVDYVVTSGTWGGANAAGKVHLKTVSATPFQAENLTGSSTGVAVAAGAETDNTLLPGGRYEFVNYNFYGQLGSRAMYGCDGVNPAFSWDGSGFAFIHTGMTTDTPTHIAAHKKHLFLSFASSVQHSSTGEPLAWSAVSGAAEIATGDDVVAMSVQPGDVLAIWDRNSTYLLYGTGLSDWELKLLSSESGAIEWSVQQIGQAKYLDDRGMTQLYTVQEYGDFANSTFSKRIHPWLKTKKDLVASSIRIRDKDQYRIFFTDNTGVIAKFRPGGGVEFTRLNYGMVVRCCCSTEDSNGDEQLYFGSDNGYVYQMDKGTSFDGSAMSYIFRLPFNHLKSPRTKKRFYKVVLELDAPLGAAITFLPDFSYGSPDSPQGVADTIDVTSGGAYWDSDADWGGFLWDAQIVGTAESYLDGDGVNISFAIRGESTYEEPHTIHGIILHYAPRGMKR